MKMKTELLQVRIPVEIKEKLLEKASSVGMSMSEYVRFLILKDSGGS